MKSSKKLDPLEAVEEVICSLLFYNGYSSRGRDISSVSDAAWNRLKPGALVERMPERIRKALRELKPHHFDKMRMDKWRFMDEAYEARKRLSDMLIDFDKKILKA